MKYQKAHIYTKRATLHAYYIHSTKSRAGAGLLGETDVQLILMTRRTEDGKLFCRIKCPINPLPVKGEFEAAGMDALHSFLASNGWKFQKTANLRLFE